MKKHIGNALVLCAGLFTIATAQAHDPSKHHGGEAPDCEAMKREMAGMKDHDRMDPVMMAMMKQCEGEHHGEHDGGHDGRHHDGKDGHHDDE